MGVPYYPTWASHITPHGRPILPHMGILLPLTTNYYGENKSLIKLVYRENLTYLPTYLTLLQIPIRGKHITSNFLAPIRGRKMRVNL